MVDVGEKAAQEDMDEIGSSAEGERKEVVEDGKNTKRRRKTLWTTRAMLTKQASPKEKAKATFRELIVFLIFLAVSCTISLGSSNSTHYYYTKAFETLLVTANIDGNNDYDGIANERHVYAWMEQALVPGLFPTEYYNGAPLPESPGNVLEDSRLLGAPRLRQVRVSNISCLEQVPEHFTDSITECYAKYHVANEDKAELVPFGEPTNLTQDAWTWKDEDATGTAGPIEGTYASTKYSGSGYTQELPRNYSEALETVKELQENLWIDQGTRALWVDFTAYNGNINLFMSGRFMLEFPPTGGVMVSYRLLALKLLRYVTAFDYFILAFEGLFVAFTLWYTFEEVIELRLNGWGVFLKPWDILDWTILIMSYLAIIFNVYRYFYVNDKLADALEDTETYAHFDRLAYWQSTYNTMTSFMLIFIWFKTFNFLTFNYTMTLLSKTLSSCINDIMGYLVMFSVVFIAYAQFGYLVFGPSTFGFHTFEDSCFSLLRIILGDFDFYALYKANRAVGPIFFFSYVVSVFFILFNVFLAIINDSYVEVKAGLEHSEYENEMAQYLSSVWSRIKSFFLMSKSRVSPANADDSKVVPEDEEARIGSTMEGGVSKAKVKLSAAAVSVISAFERRGAFAASPSSSNSRVALEEARISKGISTEMNARMVVMEEKVGSIADKVDRLLVAISNIELAHARMQKEAARFDVTYDSDEPDDRVQQESNV